VLALPGSFADGPRRCLPQTTHTLGAEALASLVSTKEDIVMRCEEIMTKNPKTLGTTSTVLEAARLMATEDVGFIPIIEQNGNVTGVVTDRDIVIKAIAKGNDPGKTRIDQVMEKNLVCCTPQDDVETVKRQMAERQVQRMLVCTGQGNARKAVGVVSFQDLAQKDDVGGTVRGVKEGTNARLQ
jgi:CBS domain-containing protein